MRIIHLTNNDFDGAGRAVLALHQTLVSLGEDSLMLVAHKKSNDETVVQVCDGYHMKGVSAFLQSTADGVNVLWQKLVRKVTNSIYKPQGLFNFDLPFVNQSKLFRYLVSADVICLYSIQSFLSAEVIGAMCQKFNNTPIVWTPLDVEPLTAGCHFNNGCEQYIEQCQACPQLKADKSRAVIKQLWKSKRTNYGNHPFVFVVASNWVKSYVDKTALFSNKVIEKIMLGVDSKVFHPNSQQQARDALNLPHDKKIVLFGCFDVKNERKGGKYLIEALRVLSNQNKGKSDIALLTFGGNGSGFLPKDIGFDHIDFGKVDDDRTMALLFQSADVFAAPSIDDFGPRVVIEAFMCHLPVVAFNVGVAEELIKHECDGVLADICDVDQFANGLAKYIYSERDRIDQSRSSESIALHAQCDQEYQAKQYVKVFHQLKQNKVNMC